MAEKYIIEPRSSPASTRGTPSGRRQRASKGGRSSRLAEVSVPDGETLSKESNDGGTEDEEGEDEDAMDVDDNGSKVPQAKVKNKAVKGNATKKSTRRSERVK